MAKIEVIDSHTIYENAGPMFIVVTVFSPA